MSDSKHVYIRAQQGTKLARTLNHIQQYYETKSTRKIIIQTIQSRFLPFCLSSTDSDWRSIALKCQAECLSWSQAIGALMEREPTTAPLNAPKNKYVHIEADNGTKLARTLSYIEDYYELKNAREIVIQSIRARFSPFCLSSTDSDWLSVALKCQAECLSWSQAIGALVTNNLTPTSTEFFPSPASPEPLCEETDLASSMGFVNPTPLNS